MKKPKGKKTKGKTKSKFKKGKSKKKSLVRSNESVRFLKYNYSKLVRQPLPPRYITTFSTAWEGFMDNTAPDWNNGTYHIYVIGGNKLGLPFYSAGSAGLGATPNITNVQNPIGNTPNLASALECSGYSNLITSVGPYQKYRVMSSAIDFQCHPFSVQVGDCDDIKATIVPYAPDTTLPFAGIQTATQGQYARHTEFTVNSNIHHLKSFKTTAQVFGVNSKSVIMEDAYTGGYTAAVSADPNRRWFWLIYLTKSINTELVAKVPYTIKVTYYVSCEEYNPAGILDV